MAANGGSTRHGTFRMSPSRRTTFGSFAATARRRVLGATALPRRCGRALRRWSMSKPPTTSSSVGFLQPRPLFHYPGALYSACFHDITSGDNTCPTVSPSFSPSRLRSCHWFGQPQRSGPDQLPGGRCPGPIPFLRQPRLARRNKRDSDRFCRRPKHLLLPVENGRRKRGDVTNIARSDRRDLWSTPRLVPGHI